VSRTVSDIGEHALISRITARLAMPPWVLVGPGDDAAVIQPERGALDVLTTDAQVEGVHFDRRFVPPDAIGHRALAVNLSDLAAMGAAPRAALLSFVLPDELAVEVVDGIVDGLTALATRHHVAIVGGNVTRSPRLGSGQVPGPLIVDVTAIGSVRPRRVLTRAGARPGDEVFITGSIGGAAAGLRSLQARTSGAGIGDPGSDRTAGMADAGSVIPDAEQKYLRPEPRVRAGLLLGRNRAASACIDLSDGLADGLRQISAASGVGMTVDEASIPTAGGVTELNSDDYELLFTARPSWRGRLRAVRSHAGDLPITRIGTVTKGTRLLLRSAAGERDLPAGFEHFR
jgi:thiamine-monophosphate kinase